MTVQEQNEKLTRKRWSVLIACCVANLCIGAIYAWSVFSGPMAEHLNILYGTALSASDLAIAFSVANGTGFITMILGGYLDEKIGARLIIMIGVVVFGLGMVVCSFAKSVTALVVGFGLMCGPANGFAYVCTVSNTVKLFPDKKGLIGGVCTASIGISAVIIPPIADALNQSVGVCKAFLIFGGVIISLGVICAMFIVNCPENYVPTGWDSNNTDVKIGGAEDKTAKQMLASPIFYVMLGMLFVGCCLGLMMISEASTVAQSMLGVSTTTAAMVVSALAFFNTGGRIAAGWISDRIGRINTLTSVYIVAIAALLLMYLGGSKGSFILFLIGICLIGLCYGSFMGVYPGFTSDIFGMKYHSLNYGIMFIGFSAAGFVGPLLLQTVYRIQGTYLPALLIAAAFSVVGFALTYIYRKMLYGKWEESNSVCSEEAKR